MSDTAIDGLTTIAGADVADTDLLPVADVSAGTTKSITTPELLIALQTRGSLVIRMSEPADATILADSAELWVDQTASPRTLNCKVRIGNSPEEVVNFVIA